ncbi:MAG: hypothetical protein AABX17_02380 [Nanoarchaeota archaeon]
MAVKIIKSKKSNSRSYFEGSRIMLKSKRSQLTILIILALIIVVVLALIIGFVKTRTSGTINFNEQPQAYLEKCVRDALQKNEETILAANGYLNLTDNYILYSGNFDSEKVPYLCKVSLFYNPCINQEPMLLEKIRREIEELTQSNINSCFSELSGLLRKSGAEITEGAMSFKINFMGDYISADITKKFSIKKGESTQVFEKFAGRIKSPLYSLIDTARTIVNYESTVCEFDALNWELYNRDIQIKKFVASEQTKIYTLIAKDTDKRFSFAVKTCVLPAGL